MIALLFDNETTDLIPNRTLKLDKQPEIWEFYGCIANLATGEIIEELDLLIKPRREVDLKSKASKVTGFTRELVENAPHFIDVAPRIKILLEKAPIAIAHNLSFDRDVLEIEFERIGEKINWPECLCTVEQTVYLKGYRLSMTQLYEILFNEKFEGAHRAKVDVMAMLRCCTKLFEMGVL
jgi:DNA polymerase III alpha subunit (gram-positive type)